MNVNSTTKKVEKQRTENELWGITNSQSQSQSARERSNLQGPAMHNKEVESGWGDWNEDGNEGKHAIYINWCKWKSVLIYALQTSFIIYTTFTFLAGSLKSGAEEEKRRQREEKRLARQKEIESKRAAKKGGALKLGSKIS